MNFFDPSGASDIVPSWASFFSQDEYRLFIRLVWEYFREEDVDISARDGTIALVSPVQVYGLHNLAQLCNSGPGTEWAEVIGCHFSGLRQAEDEAAALDDWIRDFSVAADLLTVRLYASYASDVLDPAKLVFREDLEGTISALVLDLPSTMQTVPRQTADAWGRGDDFLFEHALKNVQRRATPNISRQQVVDGVEIFTFLGDSFLTSTHALLLDSQPGCVGPHGALVSVPNRHAVICYPIADMNVVTALNSMIPVTEGMFEAGPGSISPYVYWYQNGKFTNLPYTLGAHSLDFDPPDEFVVLLSALSEDDR